MALNSEAKPNSKGKSEKDDREFLPLVCFSGECRRPEKIPRPLRLMRIVDILSVLLY